MKKLIASTAIVFAGFAGAASAMTADTQGNVAQIQTYAPNVDVSSLTDVQINTLLSLIHSGDSESDKRSQVQAYLN